MEPRTFCDTPGARCFSGRAVSGLRSKSRPHRPSSVQGREPSLEALTTDLVGLDDHPHALGGRELAGGL